MSGFPAEALLALLLLFLILPHCSLAATNAPGPVYHSSIRAASEAAASDQSLVLVIFGAEWCGPCHQLKKKTLASREFLDQAGALHLVEIDVDGDKNLAGDYGVEAVPTLVAMTADNKIVSRQSGFLETAELLLWLREARDRVREGKWEGTAPGSKVSPIIAKAAAGQLDDKDLARLIELLGEPGAADREAASRLLVDQREAAVLPLIGAVTNAYLGVRIAACDALRSWAPVAADADPWQSPAELAETAAALRKWWAATGRLPSPTNAHRLDPALATSVAGALDALRQADPAQRTEAMSVLAKHGPEALPSIREAIRGCEKAGDQRSLTLLEDVRWAILVPDSLEQAVGNVRQVLARGKGPERQAAATRLGRAGRAAIPALAELANDADGLVVESAVRALASIGGKDATPAMAALLKAGDSNLRMTAAQALGHSKNPAAVQELLTVFGDSNEVVVCTALSAVEELYAQQRSSPKKVAPEVSQALVGCLKDPRWRVRAAAAEVAGKLETKDRIPELTSLLEDADGFVVKNALGTLRQFGAAPEPATLIGIAQRLPGLRREVIEMLIQQSTEEAVKAATEIYQTNNAEARLEILQCLSAGSERGSATGVWQGFLGRAAAEPDARLRHAAAEALSAQLAKVAAALVGPLLADSDAATRTQAAAVVLSVLSGERVAVRSSHGTLLSSYSFMDVDSFSGSSGRTSAKTNPPPTTAEQIAAWHKTLEQNAGPQFDPLSAAAWYVTGDTNAGLGVLLEAMTRADPAAWKRLAQSSALAAIVPRLPWPAGKPLIEKLSTSPALFLRLLHYSSKSPPGLQQFLWEPARFRAAVEPASIEDLQAHLPQLLSTSSSRAEWSLLSDMPSADAVILALLGSTNAAWRAAAVFALSHGSDLKETAIFEKAVQDSNSWVRIAAIAGLSRAAKDRPALEAALGPLLSDPEKRVAQRAAFALLERETRSAAGFSYEDAYFEFEKIHVWSSFNVRSDEQRPLAALQANPPFLAEARRRLAETTADEAGPFALLLAQYGDFTGLDRLLTENKNERQDANESLLSTMVALSRDVKYLPQIRKMVAAASSESDLRRLLQAIKGFPGAEARELRLEINKKMRQE